MNLITLSLLAAYYFAGISSQACPNGCSGHGSCEFFGSDGAICFCTDAYSTSEAPDCSLVSSHSNE